MSGQFRMCRVCMVHKGSAELQSIFRKSGKTALEIYLISGTRIMEFSSHNISALICSTCLDDLTKAMRFRKRCLDSDDFFKKSLQDIEMTIWSKKYSTLMNGESFQVNQEPQIIKSEPMDFGCTTVFEDNDLPPEMFDSVGKYEMDEYPPPVLIEKRAVAKIPSQPIRRRKRFYADSDNESDSAVPRNEQGMVECKYCSKNFTRRYSLKCHITAIHQKLKESEMPKCHECGKLFKVKYYLQKHLKRAHRRIKKRMQKDGTLPAEEKQIGDDDEDEIFKEEPIGHNCPHCNKYLTSRQSLKDHIRVKHEFTEFKDRFLCDYCGKDFTLKHYLLKHIKATHVKVQKIERYSEAVRIRTVKEKKECTPLPCSICGKLLKNKTSLASHEKTHRVLSPSDYYYCDLCGNKFKNRGEMGVHIKNRHLYKIRYPCEICGKSWRTRFQLNKHIKIIHRNIKEFKCEYCEKAFGDKNKLVAHSRIHTGETPFQCEHCDRKFMHQTDYRRHVWGHTGRRPYKCKDACGKGFMKQAELIAHVSRCHHHINAKSAPDALSLQYQTM